jgi:hypothetical protein
VVASGPAAPSGREATVKPSGVQVVADVVAVDAQRPSITIKGPLGNRKEIRVQDAGLLSGVKPGDQVGLEYVEALAISVDAKR